MQTKPPAPPDFSSPPVELGYPDDVHEGSPAPTGPTPRPFAQAVTRLRNGLPRLAIAYAALGAETAVASLKEWVKFLALLEEDRPHRRPPITLARLRELQRGFGFATLAEFIAAVEDSPVPVEAPGAAPSPAPLDRQLRGALIAYDDHLAAITQQLAALVTTCAATARAIEHLDTTIA